MTINFEIFEVKKEHKQLVETFITDRWSSTMSVSKGRILNTVNLPGFLCLENNQIIGLVTYHIINDNCEIVTLNTTIGGLQPN